jgi:hypothetical protein
MKRLFIVLTLSMIMLLPGCNNRKYGTLELKNLQLQQQVDSLRQLAIKQRMLADSSAVVAIKQKMLADSSAVVAIQTQKLLMECRGHTKIKK